MGLHTIERSFYIKFLVCCVLLLLLLLSPYRINLTASMPIGVYKKVKTDAISRGDLVAVCLPKMLSDYALLHHILNPGRCPTGATPLLKKVIAIPHDSVLLTRAHMLVNQKTIRAPVQPFDRHGEPLKIFIAPGFYQHISTVWLYGANDPVHSFDSRYFGGVDRKNIVSVVEPVFVFHAHNVRDQAGVKPGFSIPQVIPHVRVRKPALTEASTHV